MNVIKTEIPDVLIFEPKVFGDERGFFFESFNQKVFEEAVGRKVEFVQDMHDKKMGRQTGNVIHVVGHKVFYAGCIISWNLMHKENWCVALSVKFLT